MAVRQRWFSRRALLLHLGVLVAAPACMFAFWWQLERALGGNELSWAYCFEWPIFAGLAVAGWWQVVHDDPETIGKRALRRMLRAQDDAQARGYVPPPVSDLVPHWPDQEESQELAAYNRYLAELSAAGQRPGRGRR